MRWARRRKEAEKDAPNRFCHGWLASLSGSPAGLRHELGALGGNRDRPTERIPSRYQPLRPGSPQLPEIHFAAGRATLSHVPDLLSLRSAGATQARAAAGDLHDRRPTPS